MFELISWFADKEISGKEVIPNLIAIEMTHGTWKESLKFIRVGRLKTIGNRRGLDEIYEYPPPIFTPSERRG